MKKKADFSLIDDIELEQDEMKDEMTKRLLPIEGGFQNFCKEVGLDNICDPPAFGTHGRDWDYYDLDELDQVIVRRSFDGLTLRISCSQFPRYARTLGEIGKPTFETDIGDTVITEVRYNHQNEMIEILPMSIKGTEKWMTIERFRSFNPKFIGVANYCDDTEHGIYDLSRVQIVPPEKELLVQAPKKLTIRQRVLRWLLGYY